MLSRLIQSEGRWIHALLVLSTITVALVLTGLLSNIVVYFSDILLILVMAWLFAFILSPLASWVERHMPVLPRVAVVAVIYGLLFVALAAIVVAVAVGVGTLVQEPHRRPAHDPGQPARDAQAVADAAGRPRTSRSTS